MLARLRVCLLLFVCLTACSRPAAAPTPSGLAGLRLGDPPGEGLAPVPVVLPSALAGALAYFTRPGQTEPFHGVALADPVYAFYRNRLFSVSADLVEPAAASRLRRDLETGYGPPFCRETAAGSSCLWRLDAVDLVLSREAQGKARFMLRSNRLAAEVLRWRDQGVPLEPGGGGD